MLKGIGQIISGQRSTDEIGGPVKIAKYSKESVNSGILGVLWFISLLSINLGLVNLFPIPLLDGGHLAYYTIEAFKGSPLSQNAQFYGFRVGFMILVTLMLFALFNDIKFLFGY
jgi:regulator of sigma E protease